VVGELYPPLFLQATALCQQRADQDANANCRRSMGAMISVARPELHACETRCETCRKPTSLLQQLDSAAPLFAMHLCWDIVLDSLDGIAGVMAAVDEEVGG